MSFENPQTAYTRIKGISERRRLPLLGRVRLGFKIKRGEITFPAELPFFLLPDDLSNKNFGGNITAEQAKTMGITRIDISEARAKEMGVTRADVLKFISGNTHRLAEELPVMLPINNIDVVFPHSYKWYGSSKGAKCTGDGETAIRFVKEDDGNIEVIEKVERGRKIKCPCGLLKTEDNPKGECSMRGTLSVIIPHYNPGGVFQINLGSFHSIIDINSGIDYVNAMVGRFALIPLILRRIPRETHAMEKKQIHFTLQLISRFNIEAIDSLRKDTQRVLTHAQYLLPEPEDINPELDEGEVIEGELDEETEKTDADEGHTQKSTIEQKFNNFQEKIISAPDLDALKMVWDDVMAMAKAGAFTKQEEAELNALKVKRKKELTPARKTTRKKSADTKVNMEDLQILFDQAESLHAVDEIYVKYAQTLKGDELKKLKEMRENRTQVIEKGGV
jgi:hypothetical protein